MSITEQPLQQASTQPKVQPILEAEHLRKEFPLHQTNVFGARRAVHAVEDATFALYPGRATALVGESGSGKTTVARMLARIYDPTSGVIRFQGKPVKLSHGSRELREYRRHVQLVFQDPFGSLNPVHSVRYHLSRPLKVFGHARTERQVTEQVLALLRRVSLSPAEQFIEKYPHQLSGGQRQRVAIARALVNSPSIVLADEPTGNLDSKTGEEIMALFANLHQQGNTIILVTHEHDIAQHAHRVIFIRDGKIASDEAVKK